MQVSAADLANRDLWSPFGEEREIGRFDRHAISVIAAKTLEAAEAGLKRAVDDEGLRYCFFLLSQIALASRSSDWIGQLNQHGVVLRPTDSVVDLARAFQDAVDDRLDRTGGASDLAEMAQRAAGEALCRLARDRSQTLFGDSGEELQLAVRSLSTSAQFGALSQEFFGNFLARFLNFYLSRVTASELAGGSVGDLTDITRFNQQLALHCNQSAGIVREFAAEWYSKTQFRTSITLHRAGGFVAVAIKKLSAELRVQQTER